MEQMELNQKTMALRKCGHYLHHSAGAKSGITEETLLAPLTREETETLRGLLEKCLENWNHL